MISLKFKNLIPIVALSVHFIVAMPAASKVNDENSNSVELLPSDMMKYLSEADKADLFNKLARRQVHEMIKNGTFEDNIGVPAEPVEFTIPVTFSGDIESLESLESGPAQRQSLATFSGGNVRCWNLQAQLPHDGIQFANQPKVPKAKASGKCEYIHEVGNLPPWVRFTLKQTLVEYEKRHETWILPPRPPRWVFIRSSLPKEHPRLARASSAWEVTWRADDTRGRPGTQIFGRCPQQTIFENSNVHAFTILIEAPSGWDYNGPTPFVTVGPVANEVIC